MLVYPRFWTTPVIGAWRGSQKGEKGQESEGENWEDVFTMILCTY